RPPRRAAAGSRPTSEDSATGCQNRASAGCPLVNSSDVMSQCRRRSSENAGMAAPGPVADGPAALAEGRWEEARAAFEAAPAPGGAEGGQAGFGRGRALWG